ncbi:MAG TPA: hypothetical protein VLS85_06400 [Hanamia sp.]|nr:hypothetical protein [Hanamia sp.]
MGKYMTFYFDAASIKKLMAYSPDYFLINVGYLLIPDPNNPAKQVAQLTVDAEACKKGTMSETALDSVDGCPVPPCNPV